MKVLIVDDQEAVRTALSLLLELNGMQCLTAQSPEQALDLIRTEDVGVVIQDMNFTKDTTSGEEGAQLFADIRGLDPDLPVILITAWTSLETAVKLVKQGAADYIAKPWDDQKLVVTVQNLFALFRARRENLSRSTREARARSELSNSYDLCGVVYKSAGMHQTITLAVNVARSDVPVLITGPNGSGKEKVAEIVQANSRRKDKPFVRVNAGALPDQLLEAELFGAEAGAFTGATKLRIGRFEAAHQGTLFLDEIGNLSAAGQMRLLRVLQTGEFERLGSSTTKKVDVRVISATNADLKTEIAAGRFREDLYFRLNVIELSVPALARRIDDVVPLAERFLEIHKGERDFTFGGDALDALEQHEWPGNVRELENRIQRAVLVAPTSTIHPADLGLDVTATAAPVLDRTPDDRARRASVPPASDERDLVESALVRARGVVSLAAAELGLSRQALYRRMQRLGIELERRPRP
jgi:DNA-binding NtrC family response regulator